MSLIASPSSSKTRYTLDERRAIAFARDENPDVSQRELARRIAYDYLSPSFGEAADGCDVDPNLTLDSRSETSIYHQVRAYDRYRKLYGDSAFRNYVNG